MRHQLYRNYKLDEFSESDLDRVAGILWTNAFECCRGGGQAVFPTFSLLSHSCHANASHVVFPNNHLVLNAKVAIKAGEEITISYISLIQVSRQLIAIFNVCLPTEGATLLTEPMKIKNLRVKLQLCFEIRIRKTYQNEL